MMKYLRQNLLMFVWRITATHMITYFVMGILAFYILNYEELYGSIPFSCLMKHSSSPWIVMGPSLQVFRGLVISLSLWFFRDIFLFKKSGWLYLWILLVGISILSTATPAPGSIEGLIYTKIPISSQLIGYLEVLPQTLFFSFGVYAWYKYNLKILNIIAIVLVSLILFFGYMALQF